MKDSAPVSGVPGPLRAVFSGAVWLALGTLAAQVAIAGLYLVVARESSAHQLGLYLAAVGIAIVAADLVDFGMNLWVLAEHDITENELAQQFVRKVSLGLLVSVAAVGITALIQSQFTGGITALSLVPLIVVGRLITKSLGVIAIRRELAQQAGLLAFLERAAATVVGLVLIFCGVAATTSLVVGLLAGYALTAVAAMAFFRLQGLWAFDLSGLHGQWLLGRPFAASDLASDVLQIHIVILGWVAGAAAAGYYGVATKLMAVPLLAIGSLSTVLMPSLAANADQAARMLRRTVRILASLVAAGVTVVIIAAPWAVPWLFGEEYRGAVAAVQAYCAVVLLVSVGQPLAGALQVCGQQSVVGRTEVAAVLPSLGLVALGSWLWGAPGAAVGAAIVLVPVIGIYLRTWSRLPAVQPTGTREEVAV